MKSKPLYEWDIETSDENGEIIDHYHADKLADLPALEERQQLVLVMDDEQGRAWAYVQCGKLPEFFTDADDKRVDLVLRRFHKELEHSQFA